MDNAPASFVVQEHRTPDGVHWDLMLQRGESLWTWRMNQPPEAVGGDPVPLDRIHDHPLRFLTYEGPVQNKTGAVRIADSGSLHIDAETPRALTVSLNGTHLNGRFRLTETGMSPHWQFCRL